MQGKILLLSLLFTWISFLNVLLLMTGPARNSTTMVTESLEIDLGLLVAFSHFDLQLPNVYADTVVVILSILMWRGA